MTELQTSEQGVFCEECMFQKRREDGPFLRLHTNRVADPSRLEIVIE